MLTDLFHHDLAGVFFPTFAKATVGKDKLSRETRDDIVFFDRLLTDVYGIVEQAKCCDLLSDCVL